MGNFWNITNDMWNILIAVVVILQIPWSYEQDFTCCSHATGTCRSVCEEISLVQLSADVSLRNQTVVNVQKYCSPHLSAFWECLNATFKDMSHGDGWSGRQCCPLPLGAACRRSCVTASSNADLARGCRRSDELAFFNCLERLERGEDCCSKTQNEYCRDACSDIFKSHLTPTKDQRQRLRDECEEVSPKVLECVRTVIKVTPAKGTHKHMHCCYKSNNMRCRETCKKVLSNSGTFQEIVDGFEMGGCGPPLPQDYFWQCFLQADSSSHSAPAQPSGTSRIERVGIDSAKWHCCPRARTTQCANLCARTFTRSFADDWNELFSRCLAQPAEEALSSCLDEVDEPCELGCDGLSFCTNFNARPTELFRSCSTDADDAARGDAEGWKQRRNITVLGVTLPLHGPEKCDPELGKTIACTMQIKPCSRDTHTTQICLSSCLEVLTQCVDWTRASSMYTPESICQTLSSDDQEGTCIRFQDYARPSNVEYPGITGHVSSPCRGNTCKAVAGEICLVNRDCVQGAECKSYKCSPGCSMGEVSPYMVPENSLVRIPSTGKGCLKICRCKDRGIGSCQPLPCVPPSSCLVGVTQHPHGSSWKVECNQCACFAGEMICSKKQCESERSLAYTTLPCNCPPHYVPVCGRNGVTYPSTCLAKCAGLNDADIDLFPCENPCRTNSCPRGQKCVPNPQVCLSLMHKPCKQFECVDGAVDCSSYSQEPVCDVEGRQFPTPCHLAHDSARLAYREACRRRCRSSGRVCGFNGRSYESECAANADMASVDYDGGCITVGEVGDGKAKQCGGVECSRLPDNDCLGITPPGACCPICGGALRILYSRKQIDRALYALQNQSTDALNLKSVLKALERQVQVAQCTVRGFLTIELDIFVSVQSTERYPSDLQLEACVKEAEKLASLINTKSSRIVSELSLSSLVSARTVYTRSCGSKMKVSLLLFFMGLLITLRLTAT